MADLVYSIARLVISPLVMPNVSSLCLIPPAATPLTRCRSRERGNSRAQGTPGPMGTCTLESFPHKQLQLLPALNQDIHHELTGRLDRHMSSVQGQDLDRLLLFVPFLPYRVVLAGHRVDLFPRDPEVSTLEQDGFGWHRVSYLPREGEEVGECGDGARRAYQSLRLGDVGRDPVDMREEA